MNAMAHFSHTSTLYINIPLTDSTNVQSLYTSFYYTHRIVDDSRDVIVVVSICVIYIYSKEEFHAFV